MSYIEYKEGQVYDPAHLRPFDLELVKQGHPLANFDGGEVRLLMRRRDFQTEQGKRLFKHTNCDWVYFFWCENSSNGALDWVFQDSTEFNLKRNLYLAPIAVKDSKPLHVGDVIEFNHPFGDGLFHKITLKGEGDAFGLILNMACAHELWRWPEDKA